MLFGGHSRNNNLKVYGVYSTLVARKDKQPCQGEKRTEGVWSRVPGTEKRKAFGYVFQAPKRGSRRSRRRRRRKRKRTKSRRA